MTSEDDASPASGRADPARADREDRAGRWPLRFSLTMRILAVNIVALGLLAGSLLFIDSYRRELLAERFRLARAEAELSAAALVGANERERRELLLRIGQTQGLRVRLFDPEGALIDDSFALGTPSYTLVDPASEPRFEQVARWLDRAMDYALGAPPIALYRDPEDFSDDAWPEVRAARERGITQSRQRQAPDRTPMLSAATPVGTAGEVVLTTRNARDITLNVREARQTLVIIVGAALAVSILLSLFLARTIVEPLRKLVRAAVRVRLGRDRRVVVPRLPDRRDEIGLLARAISDMSAALRERIDAVERFAADVAHELKNPLTSLRSALENLDRVEDAQLRGELMRIARDDVRRIDFLITEIADASRIDAELSRTPFEPVDMAALVQALVAERERREIDTHARIEIIVGRGDMLVPGDAPRLERVLHNLVDNAASFSPAGALIAIAIERTPRHVVVSVEDEGPGIPAEAREKVFARFHSLRPEDEEFGRHSGLGLAIARTIVEAHFGTLAAAARLDDGRGARLVMSLPAWHAD